MTKDGEFGSETTLSFVFRLSSLVPRLSAVCWVAGLLQLVCCLLSRGSVNLGPPREPAAAGYVELGEILRRHPRPCNSKDIATIHAARQRRIRFPLSVVSSLHGRKKRLWWE